MTWSVRCSAWGRLRQTQHDARVQDEAALAAAILRECPGITRDAALREAARILENAP